MSKFIIEGGKELSGEITISGAKNSALKILAASILSGKTSIIHNVPDIIDISKMENLLRHIGAEVEVDNNSVTVNPAKIHTSSLDPDLTKKIRASIVLVGPLLAKFGNRSEEHTSELQSLA